MVYPLQFSEVLQIKGIGSYFDLIENRSEVLSIVDGMMYYGSFVEVLVSKEETLKRDLISTYYGSGKRSRGPGDPPKTACRFGTHGCSDACHDWRRSCQADS